MNIAVIGLGGAGGNIADEAAKLGFTTGAINFSQKDLDALDNVEYKLKIMGSEGVGHNREVALSLMQKHFDSIHEFLNVNFSTPSIECIVFAASTSGGSGAGIISVVIDVATEMFPDKVVCAAVVIPDEFEATKSQINCSETFEDLSKLEVAVFPIDNNKVRNSGVGKNKVFEITNKTFVELLSKIVSYTDKHSKNGNFDKRDLLTILKTRGVAIMAESDIASINSKISSQGIADSIHQSWDKSIFAPVEFIQVVRAGVIFDAQEYLMEHLNHETIFKKFKEGMPIDLFEGNYHESNGKVLTIISGLPWCKSRLAQVDELIEKSKSKVESALSAEQDTYQSKAKAGEVSALLKTSSSVSPQEKPKRSASDIFSKWKR
jgi:cell division GTPase FtsZ